MNVGFTGTREGMTNEQAITVSNILVSVTVDKVHHGDCIGADADFHRLARGLKLPIKGHPPTKDDYRAFCDFDEQNPPKSYYARNRTIVNEGKDLLIATPKESEEQPKGGTWYTVGYASTVKRWTVIVWPDGSTEERNV